MSPSCHTPLIESAREECDAQELAFVREYARTGSTVKSVQKAGYRLNKKMITPAAARVRAKAMLDTPRIRVALKEIRATLAAATHVSLVSLTHELEDARELAERKDHALAMTAANREKFGQVSGGIAVPFPAKTKWMHWDTYAAGMKTAEQLDREALVLFLH